MKEGKKVYLALRLRQIEVFAEMDMAEHAGAVVVFPIVQVRVVSGSIAYLFHLVMLEHDVDVLYQYRRQEYR